MGGAVMKVILSRPAAAIPASSAPSQAPQLLSGGNPAAQRPRIVSARSSSRAMSSPASADETSPNSDSTE